MFQRLMRNCHHLVPPKEIIFARVCSKGANLSSQSKEVTELREENLPVSDVIDTRLIEITSDAVSSFKEQRRSVLDKCEEDISHVAPYLKPTFNFAAYINKSETLQELLKMGVNLHKVEKIKNAPQFILGLKFESDIKNYITFFHDLGLSVEAIANLITKNPFILKEDLNNLQVRVNYLKYKRYKHSMILHIIEKNPQLLSHSTQEIDKMLGFIKKEFGLTADELRTVTSNKPRLITYNQNHIRANIFVVTEEMGFTPDELKNIVIKCPVIFMKNQHSILKTFEYIHKQMGIDLESIAELPEVLTCREFRIKQRHQFLVKLGKAQYDPRKANYVSLLKLVSGSDADFCIDIAKSTVQAYNAFLKTM